jgi:hypothetical protein
MKQVHIVHNNEIKRIILGTPEKHDHLRLLIELANDEILLLPEACVAAIVRAYCTIKTHPVQESVQMTTKKLQEKKSGYAQHQLLEQECSSEEIARELQGLLE